VNRRLRALVVALAALTVAGLVAACGSFDSKGAGESLIRSFVSKSGQGLLTLNFVNCPSGIPLKAGTAYSCKVAVRNVRTDRRFLGTISVQIVKDDKLKIYGPRDVHLVQGT
jgi:hypothetical protein